MFYFRSERNCIDEENENNEMKEAGNLLHEHIK